MNYIKKIRQTSIIAVLICICAVISVGCNAYINKDVTEKPESVVRPKEQTRQIIMSQAKNIVVVYFATPDNRNLVPVTLDVNPTEEMAKVAVEKLLAGPSNETLTSPIPEGTKLKDLYKFENIAYVDLTPEFLNAKSEEAADVATQGLIYTLTEFQQVDSIQILIDGKVPSKSYGSIDITKTLHRPNKINFYGTKQQNYFRVYYPDNNALYMVPLTFATDQDVTAEVVIKQLLQDPPESSGLGKSPIWPGTKLLNAEVKDNIAIVNFSKEILAYGGGSANEANLVNSLMYTLTELQGINKVQLLIEGTKPEYLPEGTDTSTPWERPDKINNIQK